MQSNHFNKLLLATATSLAMSGCFFKKDVPTPANSSGTFVDSFVQGLSYSTSSNVTGKTNAEGKFNYAPKDTSISFSVGGIELGSAKPASILTPLDLAKALNEDNADNIAANIAVFLQTLDNDGDAENGIDLTAAAADLLGQTGQALDFTKTPTNFLADLTDLLYALSPGGRTVDDIIGRAEALLHLFRNTGAFLADPDHTSNVTWLLKDAELNPADQAALNTLLTDLKIAHDGNKVLSLPFSATQVEGHLFFNQFFAQSQNATSYAAAGILNNNGTVDLPTSAQLQAAGAFAGLSGAEETAAIAAWDAFKASVTEASYTINNGVVNIQYQLNPEAPLFADRLAARVTAALADVNSEYPSANLTEDDITIESFNLNASFKQLSTADEDAFITVSEEEFAIEISVAIPLGGSTTTVTGSQEQVYNNWLSTLSLQPLSP